MSKLTNKSRIILAASVLSIFSNKAYSELIDPTTARLAQGLLDSLNNPKTRTAASAALRKRGVTESQIKELSGYAKTFNCELLLESNSKKVRKPQEKIVERLLYFTQTADRLSAIYTEIQKQTAIDTIASSTVQPKASLKIDKDGTFISTLKGVTREGIFESFRQAAINDAKLTHPAIQAGTQLTLHKAKVGGFFGGKDLRLKISVLYPGEAKTETFNLSLDSDGSVEDLDQLTVAALMTIASSQHLADDTLKLRREINAIATVTTQILTARMVDKKNRVQGETGQLQEILDVLQPGSRASRDVAFGRLIMARKKLTDYLMLAGRDKAVGSKDVEVISRTNMFRAASNQDVDSMQILAPKNKKKNKPTASAASSSTDTYYSYYWGYDPLIGYYYPWVLYYNSPYSSYWAPYYYAQILSNQGMASNEASYFSQSSATYNDSVQRPTVYQNDSGDYMVGNPSVNSNLQGDALIRDGWREASVDSGTLRGQFDDAATTRADRSVSTPVTEDGRSTSTIRVTEEAITTTGTSGWFSSIATPSTETKTTTGSTWTSTTDTTTTGVDYTTTTTTTGSDYTTTGSDSTTTTTGSDF